MQKAGNFTSVCRSYNMIFPHIISYDIIYYMIYSTNTIYYVILCFRDGFGNL
jgi:hypothetical protein